MVRLGLLCVAIIIVWGGLGATMARAQASDPWLDSPVMVLSAMPVSAASRDKGSCMSSMSPIVVAGISNERPACIYGVNSAMRFARYADENGVTRYAVSFSSDQRFYEVRDVCVGSQDCLYSQSEDAALIRIGHGEAQAEVWRIDDFSRNLTRHQQAGVPYYKLTPEVGVAIASGLTNIRSMAISANEQWAVVEAEKVGLARIDMRTHEIRWIRLFSDMPDYSEEYAPHLTISNSGQLVAQISLQQSLEVIVIDETCGTSGASPQYTQQCSVKKFGADPQFHGDTFGVLPRFTDNGKQLSFISDSGESIKKIVISPQAYEGVFNPHYLAFGDSFTSGEGELDDMFYLPETNTTSNKCHVSQRSYPYKLANSWDVLATNHACSGSRIADVRAKSNLVLADVSQQPSLLSVGIGGNDVNLIGKLKTCLGPGTCQWALPGNRAATSNEIKRLLPELIGLINELQRNASAPVFLVGYPSVINPEADAQCDAMVSIMLSHEERQYMGESIRYLNKIIKSAARYTEASYVDIEDTLRGERLCDDTERSMNAVRFGDDIAPFSSLGNLKIIGAESFHPTPRGHQLIASAAEVQLANIWQSSGCDDCQVDTRPSPYWSLGATTAQLLVLQYSQRFIAAETIEGGSVVPIAFPRGSFSPSAPIRIELHSTPQEVATLQASPDGSLTAEIAIPYGPEGYHSLHAVGHSFSGEPVDMYQTIYVEKGMPAQPSAMKHAVPAESIRTPGELASRPDVKEASLIPSVLGLEYTSRAPLQAISQQSGGKTRNTTNYLPLILITGTVLLIILLLLLSRRV